MSSFPVHPPPMPQLSADERARFEHDGWVGAYPLLSPDGVRRTCELWGRIAHRVTLPTEFDQARDTQAFERRPWFKSLHTLVPEYYDLACHPAIVGRVASILGPDLIAWGMTIRASPPGNRHRWHVDIEHMHWPGVSVYLGLQNNDLHSTLKVLNGSHFLGASPQNFGVRDDASALQAVRSRLPQTELLAVPVQPGEFFIFHGQLWHGSHNTGGKVRMAMILHYSRPDVRVRIPLTFNDPVAWHGSQPPCVLVSGSDRYRLNRLVERPASLLGI